MSSAATRRRPGALPLPGSRKAALGAAAAVLAAALVTVGGGRASPREAARAFLQRYVTDEGRVVRRDQGGDTVSEGQAYAMLLTVALGDEDAFARVWSWTRAHLQRPDDLFAWRWADGRVVDSDSAADADVDIARALLLAAWRFGDPGYARAGMEVAAAVLEHETVQLGDRTVVVAGPWARRPPYVVNPGYLDPRAYGLFAAATRDPRWRAARRASYELLSQLLSENTLPPDWARLTRHFDAYAAPPPGEGSAPLFSYDASRVTLRLAQDCSSRGRRLAAAVWERLSGRDRTVAAYTVEGEPAASYEHPATLVAAAAAAHAAGEQDRATALLHRAWRVDRAHPTYFGSALVALGRLVVEDDVLDFCPEVTG